MNKQEQIEKMAKELTGCKWCSRVLYPDEKPDGRKRCPCSPHWDNTYRAESLIKAGYINGADFVEWLKSSKYMEMFSTDEWYCFAIKSEQLKDALQEYLKGE